MAEALYDVLTPYLDTLDHASRPTATDHTTVKYLDRLTTLSLSDLTTSEPASLSHHSHTLLRSLQALSKRSHRSVVSSSSHLSKLSSTLPQVVQSTTELQHVLPSVESNASNFAEKYRRGTDVDNDILARRRKALLLSSNADRVSSILDLPSLLSTAISNASQPNSTASSVNYASALDLYAHIKRLGTLYPQSPLVKSISIQAEKEMRILTSNLITSLQSQNVKLAGAMRTIGWLRRVAPELDEDVQIDKQTGKLSMRSNFDKSEGPIGAVFLVCRLSNLINMLEALEPLRELADAESKGRGKLDSSSGFNTQQDRPITGQQTERYLKRYIEIFREQSFAIVSMYKSIFPSALPLPGMEAPEETPAREKHLLLPLPSPLATFPAYLVDMLFETLRGYLPNVKDRASRDSLMTQVLYCAGSLGRLGGDFSMMLALLEDEDDPEEQISGERHYEWVDVMKKHRVQASRLELLASGVGTGKPLPRDATLASTALSP